MGDGDVRDAVLNLGDAISFKDDGPTLTLNAITTDGLGLTTQDAETIGAAFDTDSANYAAAFAAASHQRSMDAMASAEGTGAWRSAQAIGSTTV